MRPLEIQNHLRTLDLPPDATEQHVREAYRRLIKICHPDKYEYDPKLKAHANVHLTTINAANDALIQYFRNGTPENSEASSEVYNSNPSCDNYRSQEEPPQQPSVEPEAESNKTTASATPVPPFSQGTFIIVVAVVCLILYVATSGPAKPIAPNGTTKSGACIKCSGSGRIKCELCRGTGLISRATKCESCGGTGIKGIWPIKWACGTCNGGGTSVISAQCKNCSGSGTLVCPECISIFVKIWNYVDSACIWVFVASIGLYLVCFGPSRFGRRPV